MEKLIKGRLIASEKMPYLSALIYNLIPCPVKQISTAGVSKSMKMYYNEDFFNKISEEEIAFVIVHEALHIFYEHHSRLQTSDKNRANVAMDFEINDDLYFAGMRMPKNPDGTNLALHFADHRLPPYKTAEWYYENIPDGLKAQCGSGAGNAFDWESDDKQEGRSSGDVNRIRKEAANAITKYKGDIPGEMKRIAEELLAPPVVDWRTKFRSSVKRSVARMKGCFDYTYSTPSNRRTNPNFVFPSMFSYIPRIGIIIDTSGSMSNEELGAGISEIQHILSSCGANDVHLAIVDAQLYSCNQIRSRKEIYAKLKGGGGSILTPAFDELEKRRCSLIIAITDGMIDYPNQEITGSKTIWLLTQEAKMRFGEQIYLNIKQE